MILREQLVLLAQEVVFTTIKQRSVNGANSMNTLKKIIMITSSPRDSHAQEV